MDQNSLLGRIANAIINHFSLKKMGASGGSKYLGAAAHTGLELTSFYVRENTTITLVTVRTAANASQNFLSSLGISGITLTQGELYIVPDGYIITAMTISAGSVIGYM